MSDYSSNFPTQSPTFAFDAKAGKLDSRLSYSRSSGGTYMSNEKALNSENLLLQSQAFDTTWTQVGLSSRSGGNADPAGGTTAHRVVEDSSSATHRVYQVVSSTGKTSLTVYAKQAVGTRYLALKVSTGAGGPYDWVVATYDLAGGTPAMTTGTGATSIVKTSTQTLSGGSFYKCTLTVESSGGSVDVSMSSSATPSPANYGHVEYAGDGASAIDVAFSSLNTTGATDYNATTSQIHRSFAPTLKTSAANEPRFEYASDGQSEGLLIEAQATNLARYSSDIASWNSTSTVNLTSNAGIAPNGQLEADLIVFPSSASQHYVYDNTISLTSGTTYTTSVYVKSAGQRYFQMCGNSSGWGYTGANFDLEAVSSVNINSATSTITAVGNGWYRLTVTMAAAATTTGGVILIGVGSSTAAHFAATAGDDYSGVLCWGFQTEVGSAASSLISTSGASATRSADSCSIVSQPILDNGSGGLVVEYDMRDASDTAYVLQLERSVGATNGGGVALTQTYLAVENNWQNVGTTTSNVFHRVAASWEAASQKISRDGGAVAENTSTVVPSNVNTLHIGTRQDGGEPINGHIRNIAIFAEPLTSTNLTTLSQI